MLNVFQIDTIILGVCGQNCPNYLKQQVPQKHFKKKVTDAVDFLHVDRHERLLITDTKIF